MNTRHCPGDANQEWKELQIEVCLYELEACQVKYVGGLTIWPLELEEVSLRLKK